MRYSWSREGESVIMPLQPMEIAFSQSYSLLRIQKKVRTPLFLRWGTKSRATKWNSLSKEKAIQTSIFFPQVVAILFPKSTISLVKIGISNTPQRIGQKGSSPDNVSSMILTTYQVEQNVIAPGKASINYFLPLSVAAPQTVTSYLLCSFITLANYVTAVGVGVLRSIFISFLGYYLKSQSKVIILLFSVVIFSPGLPKGQIYGKNEGSSSYLSSWILLYTPVVL